MTYILYNPLANGGRGDKGLPDVLAALAAETPQVLDITQIDTAAFLGGLTADDKVVLCGGDGTVNRLVNDLCGQAPAVPIHVWRYGTGNDFIRDVILDDPHNDAPTILLNEHMPDLPVVQIAGREPFRFLNGCSCGVDALVCGMVEESRLSPKKSGYAVTALRAFRRYQPVHGRVTVDGEVREYDRIWLAVSMNGRFQGGGMKFAPDQKRHGDTLCCMVWHGTSALGTLLHFPFVIVGKHGGFANCDIRYGREIAVELDAPTVLQYDGEVIDGVSGYTARK